MSVLFELPFDLWRRVMSSSVGAEGDGSGHDQDGSDVVDVPLDLVRAVSEMFELGAVLLRWVEGLGQPAFDALRAAPWSGGQADDAAQRQAGRLRLFWDAYASVFGELLQAPGIGPSRELNDTLLRWFGAWLDLSRASSHQAELLARTWLTVQERFPVELLGRSLRGEGPATVRELLGLYMEVAEEAFGETFSTQEYVEAQARAGGTGLAYRLREREVADVLAKVTHLPGPSEVDEAHRNIYELRKEVRSLRRQLLETRAQGTNRAPRPRSAGGGGPGPGPTVSDTVQGDGEKEG